MKYLKFFAIAMAFSAVLSSCKKNKDDEPSGPYLKVKMDGAMKNSTGPVTASIITDGNRTQVQILGQFSVTEGITLITNSDKVGEYPIFESERDPGVNASTAVYSGDITKSEQDFDSASGKLIITSSTDKLISGTFEFTAKNEKGVTKTFSGGSFQATVVRIQG